MWAVKVMREALKNENENCKHVHDITVDLI